MMFYMPHNVVIRFWGYLDTVILCDRRLCLYVTNGCKVSVLLFHWVQFCYVLWFSLRLSRFVIKVHVVSFIVYSYCTVTCCTSVR